MKKIIFLLKITTFFIISFVVINLGLYLYAYLSPKIPLKSANQISIYDNNNNLISANVNGKVWIKLKNINKNVINSTVATEDKNFYKHQGFDYLRIIKAGLNNIKNRNISQGASTISQQYIKNMYLNFNRTWSRKIEEAFLTFKLETHYNKDEILEGYLNCINYGSGNYGIENASKYYFNKSSKYLTLAEATLLSGIPKNPSKYNPINNVKNSKLRQKIVLDSLVKNNYISKKEAKKAFGEKLNLIGNANKEYKNSKYYTDAVVQELNSIKTIPKSLISTGGIKIYTNFDYNSQKILENNIEKQMPIDDDLQVASMVVEPKTGKIIALVGGKDYDKSEFNRVTQAKRQVGSTMKTFLYYSALENGFTPSSTFTSEKTVFSVSHNKTYTPQNYKERYANKKISLASAIAYSDNIFAVKTHLFLGEKKLVETAKRVGINENLEALPSLPLGTNEINMKDYSNGYSTLANSGRKNKSYLIRKVTDINNNILYEFKNEEELVINSKLVFILNEMLSNTYNYNFVDYVSPTMISVQNKITKKYAVKSGSTNTDYWTIGYNPDLLVMVWNGYDNNRSLKSAQALIGKNIWVNTIEELLKEKKENWYTIPDGVITTIVNPVTGKIENSSRKVPMYYLKGTEPDISNDIINNIIFNKKNR